MSNILYDHIWAYAPIFIDFSPQIGQLSIFWMRQTLYETER